MQLSCSPQAKTKWERRCEGRDFALLVPSATWNTRANAFLQRIHDVMVVLDFDRAESAFGHGISQQCHAFSRSSGGDGTRRRRHISNFHIPPKRAPK